MAKMMLGQRPVLIGPEGLVGMLGAPESRVGLIILAHGSGSDRLSPRNNHVAFGLNAAGFATLLLDLLTPFEETDRADVFDVDLLTSRLLRATMWAASVDSLAGIPIGYFGASTGARATLVVAASAPDQVHALVSRGGRPDLAGAAALARVSTPTQLIVGSLDGPVIDLNREAMRHLACPHELLILPGAGHLFEEPGTLDIVIAHARRWFGVHLIH